MTAKIGRYLAANGRCARGTQPRSVPETPGPGTHARVGGRNAIRHRAAGRACASSLRVKIIINIDVPELGPAIAFYTAALGLAHSRTLDDDVAELTGPRPLSMYCRKPGNRAVKAPPVERDYQRHWTPVHFDLVVPTLMRQRRAPLRPARNRKPTTWTGADHVASALAILSAMGSVSSSSNAAVRTPARAGAAGQSFDPRPLPWIELRPSAHNESRNAST